MATVVNYSATLRTRNKNSIANAKTGRATQEFYNAGDNYAGIILFSGMNLTGKVITGLQLTITSASSGYGASSSKTVYLRKALYQNDIADGVTGAGYAGDALGTFTGSFYNNTTTNTITGDLLSAMGAYISQGNNAFVIYNPSPHTGSQGWSTNYLQWTSVTLTVTYEEAVSVPTTSVSSVNMGSAVTIFTNRTASTTTHTITFAFGNSTGTIGTDVGSSVNNGAAPSLSLQPNYNDTTNLIRLEGSYAGLAALSVSEDSSGTNRRTIQIRNKALENSLNNAALLLNVENGTTTYYRLYHEGQSFGIPITKGGTGAVTAETARSNLGCDNASNLTTGTIATARLPFKVAFGSGSVAGNSALVIDYTSTGFTSIPCVVASYSTTGTNWSGDNGALKIHSKTATGATIIVGGSFNNLRQIDWIAVGV